MFVSVFRASTSTPGRTAPLVSVTTPWLTPVVICVCARAGKTAASPINIDATRQVVLRILDLLHPPGRQADGDNGSGAVVKEPWGTETSDYRHSGPVATRCG